ncbi:MAG: zf-TFIIB domain-containing protein [Armatimonadota bacterium]|nr:zf-TFIIB domain-containing protein [Armatimonadota bacterium]
MKVVCPRCDTRLLLLVFRDVEVDVCERCGGAWMDTAELQALLSRATMPDADPLMRSLSATAHRPDGAVLCPRCDAGMVEVCAGDLRIDRCPEGHGVWLDGGELDHLLRQPVGAASVLAEVLGRHGAQG